MSRLTRLPGRLRAAPQRIAPAPKVALPFYQTPEWRALVAAVKAARGSRCEKCQAAGVRIFADHVKELKDGGAALDPDNIMLLCGRCHAVKTAAERKRRAVGGGRKFGA